MITNNEKDDINNFNGDWFFRNIISHSATENGDSQFFIPSVQ